jgi:hypothetical protein
MRQFIVLAITAISLACAGYMPAADAQQRGAMQMRASPAQLDSRFSAAFQAAMESGDYHRAGMLVGENGLTLSAPRSTSGRSSRLSIATPGGTTRDYTCNGGNCACAGASDCVAMAPICEEGTIGCNDYGCTCKEA